MCAQTAYLLPTKADPSQHAVSPEDYADRVARFATLETGVGEAVAPLYNFLKSQHASREEGDFVTIYDLTVRQDDRRPRCTNIESLQQFAGVPGVSSKTPLRQIVFLRGYPSHDWILALGAKYEVDPEFFSRHMDFRQSRTSLAPSYSIPALPSTSWHMMRLPCMTIGTRDGAQARGNADNITRLRTQSETSMERYVTELVRGGQFRTGDSVIRRYHLLDERNFVLEQLLTICLKLAPLHWIGG